jgi:hypothetical protein
MGRTGQLGRQLLKVKSQKDFWSGLMFIIVGLGFAAGALNYQFGSSAKPGPAFFPFGLGMLLALLGALVLFNALTIEREGGDRVEPVAWRPTFFIILSVVLFGLALPWLGMILTLPLLIFVTSLAGDEFKLKEVLINIVVLTLGAWLIFIKGLNLVIPLWPTFIGS